MWASIIWNDELIMDVWWEFFDSNFVISFHLTVSDLYAFVSVCEASARERTDVSEYCCSKLHRQISRFLWGKKNSILFLASNWLHVT